MIDLLLQREPTRSGATFGTLYLAEPGTLLPDMLQLRKLCETLEDAIRPPGEKVRGETCIPPGVYRLHLATSPKFGPDIPFIEDVPGFSDIRIHAGNYTEDTDGCILVGSTRSRPDAKKPWVGRSRDALFRLQTLLQARGQPVYQIQIRNPEGS